MARRGTPRDATSTFNAWNYHLNDEIIAVFEQTENEIDQFIGNYTSKLIIGGGKQVDFGKGFNATFVLDCDFAFDKQRHTLISGKVISLDPHFGMEFG